MLVGGPDLRKQQLIQIPRELADLVSDARRNVPAYANYPPLTSLSSLNDFQRLPLVTAEELVESPEGFRSRGAQVFRISSSGGSTGKQKTLYRTYRDHISSAEAAAEVFSTATVGPGDSIAILQPFDIWGIGFLALEAFRIIGATSIPIGMGLSDEECLQYFEQLRPTMIYSTPSRARVLCDLLAGVSRGDKEAWAPRGILLAGEPLEISVRERVRQVMGADVFSIYGSEETDGLGAECRIHSGIHLLEKGILYEVVDEVSLLPTESTSGLLVVTVLAQSGTVLLRYCTDDHVQIDLQGCPCGKPTATVTAIRRRPSGVYLWDALYITEKQIASCITSVLGRLPRYQCVLQGDKPPQSVTVLIDTAGAITTDPDTIRQLRAAIMGGSPELSVACRSGDVSVIVKPALRKEFKRNIRGKVPIFVREGE